MQHCNLIVEWGVRAVDVVFQIVCRQQAASKAEVSDSLGGTAQLVFVYNCAGVWSVQMCRCAESECCGREW